MFGVLTVQTAEHLPAGKRAVLRLRSGKGLEYREDLFRTAMFCSVQVTLYAGWRDSLRNKRVREALLLLRAKGVREAVLPAEWQALACKEGIASVSIRPGLEACAAQAVYAACRTLELSPEQVCLAVYGKNISRMAAMQLLTMAKTLRTLRIYGEGNEGLRTQLWRSCGIVDRGPMPENAPVLGLLLQDGDGVGETLLTVDLSGGSGTGEGLLWAPNPLPPQGVLAKLPQGADSGVFAAAFLQAGALQAREIHVSRLDIPAPTQYNKEIVENCF